MSGVASSSQSATRRPSGDTRGELYALRALAIERIFPVRSAATSERGGVRAVPRGVGQRPTLRDAKVGRAGAQLFEHAFQRLDGPSP